MKAYISCKCGTTSVRLARLRAAHPELEILVTKHNKELRAEHLQVLANAGMETGAMSDVVVDGGRTVLLSEVDK
mgnify:CR=1 FL=1